MPQLGSIMELALVTWVQASPEGMRVGEQSQTPAGGGIGWATWSTAGEHTLLVQMQASWRADQFSYHPGPDPGLELAYPKIYTICELLEPMKGQSC